MEALDPLLSVDDLAEYLNVPVATIYAWRYHHRGPPGFCGGRHVRFRQDVEDWIADQAEHSEIDQAVGSTPACGSA